MAKGYKKYCRGNRDKYSTEHSCAMISVPAVGQAASVVVNEMVIQGMRKVKHLTLNLSGAVDTGIYWALVYVPAGTAVGNLNTPSDPTAAVALYNPNQFVMGCGVVNFSAGPCRISSPLSRNLNSGDTIWLLLKSAEGTACTVWSVVNYAITLQ